MRVFGRRAPAGSLTAGLLAAVLSTGLAWWVAADETGRGLLAAAGVRWALADADLPAGSLDPRPDGGAWSLLVIGSDERDGLPADIPARGRLTGRRADAVSLWIVRPGALVTVVTFPRDVRVAVPGHGEGKLAGALEYGPAAMVGAVRSLAQVPVHHYVVVDLAAVAAVVDAVGGVDVALTAPLRDPVVRLDLPAGHVRLDGADAVRFARARRVTEFRDGAWQAAGGDLARVARQHQLLAALLAGRTGRTDRSDRTGTVPTALEALRLARVAGDHVAADASLGPGSLRALATGAAAALRRPGATVFCVLPSASELVASPFPPQHAGSTGLRALRVAEAAAMLRWATDRPAGTAIPTGCSPAEATP